jgi:hypothetical protein
MILARTDSRVNDDDQSKVSASHRHAAHGGANDLLREGAGGAP